MCEGLLGQRLKKRGGIKECHPEKIELELKAGMLALCKILVFTGKQAKDF